MSRLRFAPMATTGRVPVLLEDVLHGMAVFDALVASAKTGAIVAVSSI